MRKYPQLQKQYLAGSGARIGDATLLLSSFNDIDGNAISTMDVFGAKAFATIDPGNGKQEEEVSFTGITANADGTVLLTGVKSVDLVYSATDKPQEYVGIRKSHAGGSEFIISNTSGFYADFLVAGDDYDISGEYTFTEKLPQFTKDTDSDGTLDVPTLPSHLITKEFLDSEMSNKVSKTGDETIASGVKTFVESPIVPTPTTPTQAAPKGYIDSVALAGVPNASTSVQGAVQEATQTEVDNGTDTGSTGAKLFVVPSKIPSTSTTPIKTASTLTKADPVSRYIQSEIDAGFAVFTLNASTQTSVITNPLYGFSDYTPKTMVRVFGYSSYSAYPRFSVYTFFYNADSAGNKIGGAIATHSRTYNDNYLSPSTRTYNETLTVAGVISSSSEKILIEEVITTTAGPSPDQNSFIFDGSVSEYLVKKTDGTNRELFVGFSKENAVAGDMVKISSDKYTNLFTGLTPNVDYYLGTAGELTDVSTGGIKVGFSVNDTILDTEVIIPTELDTEIAVTTNSTALVTFVPEKTGYITALTNGSSGYITVGNQTIQSSTSERIGMLVSKGDTVSLNYIIAGSAFIRYFK